MKKITLLMMILMLSVFSVHAQEEDENESDVSVTAYNQGTALIRDRRTFDFSEGTTQIDFTDVASSIDATSVSFVSLTDPEGTYVIEQNYVYDLVGTSALLERYIDQVINVTTTDGSTFTGTLLSGRGDIILQDEAGQVMVIGGDDVRNISFPALPSGLITRPTLRWLVFSNTGGTQDVELTYLTGGISWTADYNILLSTDNTSLDLNGWITLTNTSGTSYEDAQLKLVAGDVNRIQPEDYYYYEEAEMMAMDRAAAAPAVAQREFFEYQLYEIGRPVTIGNNETKQVEFVTGTDVAANTYYVYDGSDYFYGYYSPISDPGYGLTGITDVQNYLEFSTGEESGLGADLPAGRVRVYQEDVDGAALLIGENRIEHTAEGEEIDIYLGNAFDLVGERTQTNFNAVANNVIQETYEIHLRNRKDSETVEIRVPERLFRWSNWEILSTSHDYTQLDSSTIEFRVDVPAGEEVVITYTVQYSWPR